MQTVVNKILKRIMGKGDGFSFTAKDFRDLGTRGAVHARQLGPDPSYQARIVRLPQLQRASRKLAGPRFRSSRTRHRKRTTKLFRA